MREPRPDALPATESDLDEVRSPIVLAFAADPFVRWLFPAPHDFLKYFPRIVAAHFARAAPQGGAHKTADLRGAAIWFPPGTNPDGEALGRIFQEGLGREHLVEAQAVLRQMAGYEPQEPHWYLRLIGVDPGVQSQGHGSALLQHCLTNEVDPQGRLAYLEATSERSVRLYERHGFMVLAQVQSDSSPPVWPMLRKPR
jgi:ribosomal protein S18 acetylase RimI-like enzyme